MSRHKLISFVKSAFRLIGCLATTSGNLWFALAWLAAWFAAAEVLGIVEEVGEP